MQLSYMRCYITLCYYRSISKTGLHFHTTPQNISRIIKRMEDELGVDLIIRTSKGVDITPQGETFLKFAKQTIYHYDTVKTQLLLQSKPKEKQYSFTLYSQEVANQLFLNDILPDFSEEYPSINVNNIVTGYVEGYSMMRKDPSSIGIFTLFPEILDYSNLNLTPVLSSPIVAWLNRQHPLAEKRLLKTSDLSNYKHVFFIRNSIKSSGLLSIDPTIKIADHYITGSLQTCFSMVANGNYVFRDFLALYNHQNETFKQQVIALPIADEEDRSIAIMTHKTLSEDSPQNLLINYILLKSINLI